MGALPGVYEGVGRKKERDTLSGALVQGHQVKPLENRAYHHLHSDLGTSALS